MYVVVLKKLSDTYLFLFAEKHFKGVKQPLKDWGLKFRLYSCVYKTQIDFDQTYWKGFLVMRDE